jgi:transcriptional regulator with XRE-family HTH domain
VCSGTRAGDRRGIRTDIPALPFCTATLKRDRKPAGYPKEIKHLGDHLKRRRMDRGQHVKDTAKLMGVATTTLTNWEVGGRRPAIRHVPKMIRFLGYDPRPKPTSLAERLTNAREGLGLSVEAMAKHLGADPGTLRGWESGQRVPRGRHLVRVGRILGEDLPPPSSLAERIKSHRHVHGWSQRELARKLGVASSTVEGWELGARPSTQSAARLEVLLQGGELGRS